MAASSSEALQEVDEGRAEVGGRGEKRKHQGEDDAEEVSVMHADGPDNEKRRERSGERSERNDDNRERHDGRKTRDDERGDRDYTRRREDGDDGPHRDEDASRKEGLRRSEYHSRDDGQRDAKRVNLGSRTDVSNVESSLRLLVPNSSAGSIIGKGGSVISEFQSQSGAKIVLSRATEFFPQTMDRILMLNGTVNAILTALHLVLSKLADDDRNSAARGAGVIDLRIVVPNRICGALIGRGGATIRSFGDDSGAQIKIASDKTAQGSVGERIITVNGSVEQTLRAAALILAKASEDSGYQQYAEVPLSYTASGGAGLSAAVPRVLPALYGAPPTAPPPLPRRSPPPVMAAPAVPTTIIVAVPDEHVGAVVGKGGRTLHEIQMNSSARIQVSDRGDFVDGTTNRKLTITGSADAVVSAQRYIAQKVQASIQMQEATGRGADKEGGGGRLNSTGRECDRGYDHQPAQREERGSADHRGEHSRHKEGSSREEGRDRGREREQQEREHWARGKERDYERDRETERARRGKFEYEDGSRDRDRRDGRDSYD